MLLACETGVGGACFLHEGSIFCACENFKVMPVVFARGIILAHYTAAPLPPPPPAAPSPPLPLLALRQGMKCRHSSVTTLSAWRVAHLYGPFQLLTFGGEFFGGFFFFLGGGGAGQGREDVCVCVCVCVCV